ncbi:UDP-glucuronic acid decarboxylase family protein [Falsiroseomonas algicola]|uniref:UDP-glucuronic acid decarboxylase family protein n=1 Tax=Falsiroseomonas algicola TaxID=2716930 RepID=UPI002E28B5D1|nr:UDP-glucuronic acid decarboxylase family protein [Falsiroseomonas algicola]
MTGGAGFLGSHVCEALLRNGEEVVCLDDFSTGTRANLAHLEGHRGFRLLQGDVAAPVTAEVEAAQVDAIYNLACPASPAQYQADPIRTLKTCVFGAATMLEFARSRGAAILQASTSEVYGDPQVHPQPEHYVGHVNPIGPRACYDEGKRCAETLFFDYRRQHGLSVKVARIFNCYGPRLRPGDGRVVSTFIVQALLGQPITIHGDGRQTRSFCYVSDLVTGLLALMRTPDAVTGPMNLGNPAEIPVAELAEMVVRLTGSRSRPVFLKAAVDDPRQRRPDITQARQVLGWAPSVPLEEGLLRTIAYFDRVLAGGEGAAAGRAMA